MQNDNDVSRRQFLQLAGALSGTAYLRLGGAALVAVTHAACTAKQESSPFEILLAEEARDFAAIAARIIPSTATPGATEAGVIYFIDNAFAHWQADDLKAARDGLAAFSESLRAIGHAGHFDEMSTAQQDDFLRAQESGAFFQMVRQMTIFGFFAMSSYGGNRDNIGWDLIGFDGHHGAWTYPFGYYDAEYAKEQGQENGSAG